MNNIVTYLVPCTVSEMWPIIGPIVAVNSGCLSLNVLVWGEPLITEKFGIKKLETSLQWRIQEFGKGGTRGGLGACPQRGPGAAP